jgi:hypothetical protein
LRRRPDAPGFTAAGELKIPADYREWVFPTSGLGMTCGPNRPTEGQPAPFNNVFVTPAADRAFLASGRWAEGTVFMLEIRRAGENVSINAGGRTQGAVVAIEAAVKDGKR